MGDPLKPIPQTREGDNRSIAEALKAIKYILDVREGRSTSDKGARWVTFDDLNAALSAFTPQDTDIKTLIKEAFIEAITATVDQESIVGMLGSIKTCVCPAEPPPS